MADCQGAKFVKKEFVAGRRFGTASSKCQIKNCVFGEKPGGKAMSKGFSQRGADGITRHYNSNGVMTGYSQRGGDGINRHYDNNNNISGFSQRNSYGGVSHYDKKGNKRNTSWW